MKLSSKSRYALRILLQIGYENLNGNQLAPGRLIAAKQEITEPYLEQIMIPLKKGGLVETVRGCNGGYKLKKSPSEITVLDVIELFDGPVCLAECGVKENRCEKSGKCIASKAWEELSSVFREAAAKITLSSILEDYIKSNAVDYVI
jgi:Rrf2 family protein